METLEHLEASTLGWLTMETFERLEASTLGWFTMETLERLRISANGFFFPLEYVHNVTINESSRSVAHRLLKIFP